MSETTLRLDLTTAKTLFKFARRRGDIVARPADDLAPPALGKHRRRWLTREGYDAPKAPTRPWLLLLLRFTALTGLRPREVTGVHWENSDRRLRLLQLAGDNKTDDTHVPS